MNKTAPVKRGGFSFVKRKIATNAGKKVKNGA